MSPSQSSWIRRIFSHNHKWLTTLITILIISLVLYFLLPQVFSAALQPEEPASPYVSARGILLQDDFTNRKSGWPSESQANASFGYQDPSFYYLELNTAHDTLVVSPGLDAANFTAETKATVDFTNTPTGDFRYGLVIRRSGEHYYAFTISPRSGTWQVLKHTPTGIEVLAQDQPAWLRSTFRLYTLRVRANDQTFSFQINNQPVIELSDPDYASGDVGFIVETLDETFVHVAFDSLKVQNIQGQPAVDVPSAPAESAVVPTPGLTPGAASIPATQTSVPVAAATLVIPTSTLSSSTKDTLPRLTPTVALPSTQPVVEAALPPISTPAKELVKGGYAQIGSTDGAGVSLRAGPGTNNARLDVAPENSIVLILDGPRADENLGNFVWWFVRSANGTEGWTAQNFLTPASNPAPAATTAPPNLTPTPISPSATPTALAQNCSSSAGDVFAEVWPAYRHLLGCPGDTVHTLSTIAEQAFQGGHLFWLKDTDQVYIILDRDKQGGELAAGKWQVAEPGWKWTGSDPEGVGLAAPAGLVEPKRGFGWLWRTYLGGPEGPLGWALDMEYGFDNTGKVQLFEHGRMFKGSSPRIYILLNDTTFYASE